MVSALGGGNEPCRDRRDDSHDTPDGYQPNGHAAQAPVLDGRFVRANCGQVKLRSAKAGSAAGDRLDTHAGGGTLEQHLAPEPI
jgi:hypothetical protein